MRTLDAPRLDSAITSSKSTRFFRRKKGRTPSHGVLFFKHFKFFVNIEKKNPTTEIETGIVVLLDAEVAARMIPEVHQTDTTGTGTAHAPGIEVAVAAAGNTTTTPAHHAAGAIAGAAAAAATATVTAEMITAAVAGAGAQAGDKRAFLENVDEERWFFCLGKRSMSQNK